MIYIVIPVFNRIESTVKCIESLLKQTYQAFVIVLVDDGSTDGTYELVSSNYPQIAIVRGQGDWWWAESTNKGIESFVDNANDDDFILTLNNDLIVKPDYLHNMYKEYHDNRPCVIGSLAMDADQDAAIIEYCGVNWDHCYASYKAVPEVNSNYSELSDKYNVVYTDLLPGRGTLYTVRMFRDIGRYNSSKFPQYLADEEFSLRAKKAGYQLLVSTKSVVYSDVSNTGINFKYDAPSVLKFLKSLIVKKSASYIPARYNFSKLHSPCHPFYFILDFARIFGSFLKRYWAYIIR